jgi:hypothetical protein
MSWNERVAKQNSRFQSNLNQSFKKKQLKLLEMLSLGTEKRLTSINSNEC